MVLASTLDKLDDIGPLPGDITVHLDAGYDSQKTRDELAGRRMTGEIALRATRSRSRRASGVGPARRNSEGPGEPTSPFPLS
jgi:hypothetical protein